MIKIRALRQFSHYHAGNFDQFEVREVKDEYAEALIGLDLAEVVEADQIQNQDQDQDQDQAPISTTTKSKKKES